MPRWLRVIRGMIGTGLTFAAGVGVVGSIAGLVALALGQVSVADLGLVAKLTVVAFIVGVAFSGILALVARSRTFDKLSLRFVTAIGAGGGFLYFLFIAFMNGARAWSASDAIANLAILTLMGAAAAAGTLILARKAKASLAPGEETQSLGDGAMELPLPEQESAQKWDR